MLAKQNKWNWILLYDLGKMIDDAYVYVIKSYTFILWAYVYIHWAYIRYNYQDGSSYKKQVGKPLHTRDNKIQPIT